MSIVLMFLHAKGHPSKSIIFKKIFNSLLYAIFEPFQKGHSPFTKKNIPSKHASRHVLQKKENIYPNDGLPFTILIINYVEGD
uniref:hypothetical protein n=1 Tax=Roseivirga sp. TaxID=1964215 RepID=UPI004047B6FC